MKKTVIALAIISVMAMLLTGCGCNHTWTEANCTTAKTCTLCNIAEGEPLGHIWLDASCETPKSCAVCGVTEGAALGHDWQNATCSTPKTCVVCSSTDGDPLGHTMGEWSCNGELFEYSCTVCGEKNSLTPKDFYLKQLAGTWKVMGLLDTEAQGSVTFHEDGTADINLPSNLIHPGSVRMVDGELFYVENPPNWGMHFYLEDHLTEGSNKLAPEYGLYLLVTIREDRQTDGTVIFLQHKGYARTWFLIK